MCGRPVLLEGPAAVGNTALVLVRVALLRGAPTVVVDVDALFDNVFAHLVCICNRTPALHCRTTQAGLI